MQSAEKRNRWESAQSSGLSGISKEWQILTPSRTQLAPLDTLDQVLPKLLSNVSIARAQIAIDQLRGVIEAKSLDRIVFVTDADPDAPETPTAAAIAVQTPGPGGENKSSDMATMVHAGPLAPPASDRDPDEAIDALSQTLDRELQQRGTRFLQWATDATDKADDSVPRYCKRFGFHPIGTLDYLHGLVPPAEEADKDALLTFEPIQWQPQPFRQFADLVERTYVETLDCPGLAEYRTAMQTLQGYQASGAYDPALWFNVRGSDEDPIGCMVLANHQPVASADNTDPSPVIEIVYMGLIPEARGRGCGKRLVEQAFAAARTVGAERMILGVDQRNTPARDIYQWAGLQPMLTETVWVKSLSSADSETHGDVHSS